MYSFRNLQKRQQKLGLAGDFNICSNPSYRLLIVSQIWIRILQQMEEFTRLVGPKSSYKLIQKSDIAWFVKNITPSMPLTVFREAYFQLIDIKPESSQKTLSSKWNRLPGQTSSKPSPWILVCQKNCKSSLKTKNMHATAYDAACLMMTVIFNTVQENIAIWQNKSLIDNVDICHFNVNVYNINNFFNWLIFASFLTTVRKSKKKPKSYDIAIDFSAKNGSKFSSLFIITQLVNLMNTWTRTTSLKTLWGRKSRRVFCYGGGAFESPWGCWSFSAWVCSWVCSWWFFSAWVWIPQIALNMNINH